MRVIIETGICRIEYYEAVGDIFCARPILRSHALPIPKRKNKDFSLKVNVFQEKREKMPKYCSSTLKSVGEADLPVVFGLALKRHGVGTGGGGHAVPAEVAAESAEGDAAADRRDCSNNAV